MLLFCYFFQTILLQDKHGVNYCVACKELDTDTDKDDPGWFLIFHVSI